ncbi:Methyltransferase-like protein [Novymonas esmeraldas]|uniref:Alpha N-terminal protein methyltransferase 1 n=1 Tax=Novymonas esmeraldas TaxID=1808958 RepID=A0AAW0F087_9TRYP
MPSKSALPQGSPIRGGDTDGKRYRSTEEMWKCELTDDLYDPKKGWYGKALEYWRKVPATVSGVLGGMDHINDVDIKGSRQFIEGLPDRGTTRALDCGAGIGRIAKSLLTKMYTTTDLLEPVEHMLEEAKRELAGLPVGEFILSSMETAQLPPHTYDLIVIQWTAIYLTDEDFVRFFKHCQDALTPNGYIFFKENCSAGDHFLVDKEDSSLTRSDLHYKRLFSQCGVRVVKEALQEEWPADLFPVKMYALR